MTTVIVSFIVCLLFFLGIGLLSATRKAETTEDYLLASRSVNPWVVALSAVATNNSGFMFIGLIGETYTSGLSAMWVMVGWVLGDYAMWMARVPDRLRVESEARGTVTIPSFLGHGVRNGKQVTTLAGAITLVFLGIYAAAQLNAGSKALHVLFDWDYSLGAILGAVIVVAYCFAGGIRASLWTDVAQSIVMFVAMVILCFVAIEESGGFDSMWTTLGQRPALTDWQPENLPWGFTLFALGWFVAGIGVVGQPHIMVRAMAVNSVDSMPTARRVYFVWNALFAAAAIMVGLAARAWVEGADASSASAATLLSKDAELALPLLAQQLLPGWLVGFVLAGLFAATISTADSQVLACSAALTQDMFPKVRDSYVWVKASTLLVATIVLAIALTGGGVFDLIVLAWSSLAAGLGPLLILKSFGRHVDGRLGLAMMIGALLTVLLWRFGFKLTGAVYDALPAMLMGFIIYGVGRQFLAGSPSKDL
ncbi:MAG: sodium/proline symporter [Bradymonadia bacterium]